MLIEAKELRISLQTAIRGLILIAVITVFQRLALKLPGTGAQLGSLTVASYIVMAMSFAVLVVMMRIFVPVKEVALFYTATAIRLRNVPGRDRYMGQVLGVSTYLVYLVYLGLVYYFFSPVLMALNGILFGFDFMFFSRAVDIAAVITGVYLLFMLWKNVQPLMEVMTKRITDAVTEASSKVAFRDCPACGAQNDIDAAFCTSCGGQIPPKAASTPTEAVCPSCQTPMPPSSKFCAKCGMEVKQVAAEPADKTRECSSCNAQVSVSAKFCPQCGATFEGEAAS